MQKKSKKTVKVQTVIREIPDVLEATKKAASITAKKEKRKVSMSIFIWECVKPKLTEMGLYKG